MAAMTESTSGKLSHKQFKRLIQREKRRLKRQSAAIQRAVEEKEEQKAFEEDPQLRQRLQHEDEERIQREESQRLQEHELWVQRERKAQEEFERKKKEEERKHWEKLEQERRIKEEWEAQQKQEAEDKERREKNARAKEDALRKEMESTAQTEDSAWHNPLAPPSGVYGTEQDKANCSFYLKTGACRFGERCSRMHIKPTSSVTLMIPNMYVDISLQQDMLDEADHDTGLEYDDREAYDRFVAFADDVIPEFERAGKMTQFKVCCNHEAHLRGNVFVQYFSEEECAEAFSLFNGRWYAQKQLSCEFSPVTNWKSAICGLFQRGVCSRGKNCNFLHVFRDPPGLWQRLHHSSPRDKRLERRNREHFDKSRYRREGRDRDWLNERDERRTGERTAERNQRAHKRYRDKEGKYKDRFGRDIDRPESRDRGEGHKKYRQLHHRVSRKSQNGKDTSGDSDDDDDDDDGEDDGEDVDDADEYHSKKAESKRRRYRRKSTSPNCVDRNSDIPASGSHGELLKDRLHLPANGRPEITEGNRKRENANSSHNSDGENSCRHQHHRASHEKRHRKHKKHRSHHRKSKRHRTRQTSESSSQSDDAKDDVSTATL